MDSFSVILAMLAGVVIAAVSSERIGSSRWTVFAALLLLLALFAWGMPARAADKITFDPNEKAVLQVEYRTADCMRVRMQQMIAYGAKNADDVLADAVTTCAPLLVSLTGNNRGAVIRALQLADDVLRSIPGVRVSK